MVAAGIKALTGERELVQAWRKLIPYQAGQSVVIKVNFNNTETCSDASNQMDAYPETVNAIVEGLTVIGVPANLIWVADPSRAIPIRFIEKIQNANVSYYASLAVCNTNSYSTDYVAEASSDASPTTHPSGNIVRPAKVLVDADHLINVPLLKGHGFAGITLGLKNHYGSVIFRGNNQWASRSEMHPYTNESINPDPTKSIVSDINNNPHIRNKTRLIVGDGLFGNAFDNTSPPEKWSIWGNSDSNILFFGTDPIATDSVMCDYINEERVQNQWPPATHASLQYGQELGLGTHDHWNNFTYKQYNLIDYRMVGSDYEPGLMPSGISPAITTLILD